MLPQGPLIILDTETAGFSTEHNPLLSIGMLHVADNAMGQAISVRFKPPPNTWLEIPIHEDQLKCKDSKTIDYWMNLDTGETKKYDPDNRPNLVITATAAEVNGFVKESETVPGWDILSVGSWGTEDYETALPKLRSWVSEHVATAVLGHNCNFDFRYVLAWLPTLIHVLPKDWACTQAVYRKAYLDNKMKGSSIGAICKVANIVPTGVLHTELGDCAATFEIWRWLRAQGH